MSDTYISDTYIIEVRPKSAGITLQAGIVVRDDEGFRFFAASHAFDALEGRHFKSPKAAERAALERIAVVRPHLSPFPFSDSP